MSLSKYLLAGLFLVGCSASDAEHDLGVDAGTVTDAGDQTAAILASIVDYGPAPAPRDFSLPIPNESDETLEDLVPDVSSDSDLGTLRQALSLPNGYGMNNQYRCGNTWSGKCFVPHDKKIRMKFFASTCAGDWQKTRFVTAMDVWIGWMNARGWTVQGPDSQDRYDYDLRCDSTIYNPPSSAPHLGMFVYPSTNGFQGTTCSTVAGRGELCKFVKGTLTIFTSPAMDRLYGVAGEAGKQRMYQNFIIHELGHAGGLGHYGTDGTDVMAVHGSGADGSPNSTDTYSTTEYNFLNNYTP
jgi:hypothetical protein